MKYVITSQLNSLDSLIDSRFGRCTYFTIFDSESKSVEFIPNPFKNVGENAGQDAVKLLANRGVDKIISGEFGLKIKSLLDSLKIQMIIIRNPQTKISEIVEMINNKKNDE